MEKFMVKKDYPGKYNDKYASMALKNKMETDFITIYRQLQQMESISEARKKDFKESGKSWCKKSY